MSQNNQLQEEPVQSNLMEFEQPNNLNDNTQKTMVNENNMMINSQETMMKNSFPSLDNNQSNKDSEIKSIADTIQIQPSASIASSTTGSNKFNLPPKQAKRLNNDSGQMNNVMQNDFSTYNDTLKKNKQMTMNQSQNIQDTHKNKPNQASKNQPITTTWQLGDQVFSAEDIKGCFSDKQVFNQANIFTRKHVNDLFEDSDDEVQEEGLVTQIHKRNMQDVYDMTPKDKKFTFLWNEFFIKLEKNKIKEKIPIKRSDIYGYLQQFMEENIEELINLHPQFVIHLFTMQDNGILDSEQIARSLKYLKDYPIRYTSMYHSDQQYQQQ